MIIKKILGSVIKGLFSLKLKGASVASKEYEGLTPKGEVDKTHLYSNIAKWVVILVLVIGVAAGKIDEDFVKKILNKFLFM